MNPLKEHATLEPPSRHPRGPARHLGRVGPALVALTGAAALMLAASCKKEQAAVQAAPPTVQVLTVTGTNLPLAHEIIGQLDSPENVEIRARVEAFVEAVLFTEGSDVKEGDPLFRLDERPFEEQLAAARGQLAQAQAGLNKYRKDVDRLRPLAEKKAIPQQDLDNAEASVEVGKAGVLSAQAMERSALLDLGYCDVRAQGNGRIGAKQVSIGDLVGKGQPTLMATISRLDPIWFYCGVSEVAYLRTEAEARRSGRTVADLPVTLILADRTEHPAPGKFVFIDRAVDPKTGTLRVRAEFPNEENVLRPGMFARIRIDLGKRPDSLVVPQRAVTELQGRSFVWVVGNDNTVSQRPVTTSEIGSGGLVLIPEGLKAGERIIVEGLQKVREGAVVRPVDADDTTIVGGLPRKAARSMLLLVAVMVGIWLLGKVVPGGSFRTRTRDTCSWRSSFPKAPRSSAPTNCSSRSRASSTKRRVCVRRSRSRG